MNKILPVIVLLLWGTVGMAQPTWAEDISCIVYSHCSSCHNSEGIGPFNLMNYQDAFNNRYAMQAAIADKSMPPWPPNQDYREFANANILSDEEITIFNEWVNAGAPEGDPTMAPEPPVITSEAGITDPDVTFTTEVYTVPGINDDLYKCFVITPDWDEDKFISEIEVYPNNRNIVHHVLMYKNLTDEPVIDDANDPELGFECGGSIEGGNNILVGEWVPGSRPWILPEGTGIKIQKGANLVMQVHYPDGSDGQQDFLTVNMKFATGTDTREVFQDQTLDHIQHLQNPPFLILPLETKTLHQKLVLEEDRTFLGVAPHAHLICTKMWSYAILPSGEQINMVEIPNWDFDWQGMYYYPEPIILPAGTELHGYARYVNNPNENPNVNNPPSWVTLGEDTEDEMMLFFYTYMFYEPGDENLVMPNGGHLEHYQGCNQITPTHHLEEVLSVSIYPNPVDGSTFRVDIGDHFDGDYMLELTDLSGRLIYSAQCTGDCMVDVPASIDNGVYLARLVQDGQSLGQAEKLVLMR